MVGWLAVRGFRALNGVKCYRTMWLWSFFSGMNLLGYVEGEFLVYFGVCGNGAGCYYGSGRV